jgi:hypothetical protein
MAHRGRGFGPALRLPQEVPLSVTDMAAGGLETISRRLLAIRQRRLRAPARRPVVRPAEVRRRRARPLSWKPSCRRLVSFAVASPSTAPRRRGLGVGTSSSSSLRFGFATARPLRTLGRVQRMAQRSSASMLGHILPSLLGRADPLAPPVDGQSWGRVGSFLPASWSAQCALRATGGVV